MPEISCIIISHNKPEYVKEAIQSVLNQTFQDWQAILIDSGVLYDIGFFDWIKDERMQVMRSTENEEVRSLLSPAPWCFNACLRSGLVKSNLITYLCDDDIWYDNAFEVFVNYWKDHPDIDAMYASQDIAVHEPSGTRYITGERRAMQIMGKASGHYMDCVVDYLQFCHTLRILSRMNEYWPEHKITEHHADGVFMDRIGALVPVYPIDIKVSQNRRTPKSTYSPSR